MQFRRVKKVLTGFFGVWLAHEWVVLCVLKIIWMGSATPLVE